MAKPAVNDDTDMELGEVLGGILARLNAIEARMERDRNSQVVIQAGIKEVLDNVLKALNKILAGMDAPPAKDGDDPWEKLIQQLIDRLPAPVAHEVARQFEPIPDTDAGGIPRP